MKIKKAWRWCDLPQLIDCEQTARILNISLRAAQKQCKEGRLPAVKVNNKWYVNTETLKGVFEG
jgi:hypothetical protein